MNAPNWLATLTNPCVAFRDPFLLLDQPEITSREMASTSASATEGRHIVAGGLLIAVATAFLCTLAAPTLAAPSQPEPAHEVAASTYARKQEREEERRAEREDEERREGRARRRLGLDN